MRAGNNGKKTNIMVNYLIYILVILQSSEEIINMLLENGAEVNIHDNNGFTYEKLRNL